MDGKRPIVPGRRAERCVSLAAALLVLIGGLTAVAAWRKGRETGAPPVQPTSTEAPGGPLAGLTILVDPGHGGYDGGARARDSGVWEEELNLQVALEVEKSLVRRGARVVMTRRADEDLVDGGASTAATKKRRDLENRVNLAVDSGADMLLSIHMNEYRSRAESGPQVFYRQGNEGGRLLAGCIQEALIAALQPEKQRAAMAGDYFVLRLEIPSVLIECGFISNAREEKLLRDSAYQERLADAIADGVTEYVRLNGGE